MTRRTLTGALLAAVAACAHPIGEPDAESERSGYTPPKSSAGSAGRGGSGGNNSGGSKASAVSGGAGKASSAGKPAVVGSGGDGDGGAQGLGPQGGSDTGADPDPSTEAGDLTVQYRAGNSSVNDNQIGPHLRIVSSALAPVELSTLSARYYFTSELASPLLIETYTAAAEGTSGYRALPGGSVMTTVAEDFVEIAFGATAGLLDAGGQVTVEIAIHDGGWVGLFDETNDYSFDAAHSSYAAWEHVTLYDAKTLVWGVEPP